MPRKIYIIDHLDCANCAAKIERKFNDHPGVEEATITFATKQLRLTAADPDSLIEELTRIARTVESGAVIYPRDAAPAHGHTRRQKHHHDHEHDHECGCGHHHDHEHGHECGCGHHHEHEHEEHECKCGHHHEHEHEHECKCGHHHEHDHECGCGHHHEHEHDHECKCGHHHEHEHEDHECKCGHHHEHEHDHECCCGHHAEEEHECGCGNHGCGCGCCHGERKRIPEALKQILLGGGLFVIGLVLEALGLGDMSLAALAFAYMILGREVLATALNNLTKGHVFDENFLMSLATIGAFFIGEYPEAVGVMLFYRVGEYFEERAVERSRSQIMEAVDLRPEVVNLLEEGEVTVIPAEEALVGDLLVVRPGDRIPLDGKVVSGESRIDTAPITGEPVPVSVKPGDQLVSGCVNTTGQLIMEVEKVLSESMVTRILDSVENAAASKPKIDRFITRFARIYTPIVVTVAAATAIIPSLVSGDWNYWVYTALSFLVMSCPCALVLSVPLAFFSGIGRGSKRGILFKGGLSIEALAKVKAVVMDKTGTITKGEFKVQKVAGGLEVLQLCASCEQMSTHPIAVSIVAAAKEKGMELFRPDELEEIPGRGIKVKVDGKTILCGNAMLLKDNWVKLQEVEEFGSVVYVAVDDRFVGYLVIADTLKEGAKDAVKRLKGQNVATVMLTGDAEPAAQAVAKETGIEEVHAKLLPHQKLSQLRQIRKEKGAAMFVGDGINDAPVLAGADVGAAMGSGADAAIEAADVVFMTSDVDAIPEALDIARQTNRVAWQNVIFALAVKLIVMALGLGGYASMWLAVFADSGVAMLCVMNSIRMLYKK